MTDRSTDEMNDLLTIALKLLGSTAPDADFVVVAITDDGLTIGTTMRPASAAALLAVATRAALERLPPDPKIVSHRGPMKQRRRRSA